MADRESAITGGDPGGVGGVRTPPEIKTDFSGGCQGGSSWGGGVRGGPSSKHKPP